MKNIVMKYAVVFSLVVASGAMLLDVSQRVQEVEREIRATERSIAREQENIRVLQAEWAYLNDPARLEMMAISGLEMGALSPEDIVSDFDMLRGFQNEKLKSSVVHNISPRKKSRMVRNISYNGSSVKTGAQ